MGTGVGIPTLGQEQSVAHPVQYSSSWDAPAVAAALATDSSDEANSAATQNRLNATSHGIIALTAFFQHFGLKKQRVEICEAFGIESLSDLAWLDESDLDRLPQP